METCEARLAGTFGVRTRIARAMSDLVDDTPLVVFVCGASLCGLLFEYQLIFLYGSESLLLWTFRENEDLVCLYILAVLSFVDL